MIKLPSYKLVDWPYKDYIIVNDLIDFEGPLLVHYMKDEKHALYYWVEGDSNFNRWLCFEVTLFELYDYVMHNISLRDLINKKNREAFFTTDISKELEYTNFQILYGYSIPEEYLPDISSYFIDEPSEFYETLFKKIDTDNYLEALRRRTIDLEIKPYEHSPNSDTVSIDDSVEFMHGFNTSYKHYVAFKFFEQFKDQHKNNQTLVKLTNKIVASSKLRLVNAAQHSFQISVATDKIMSDVLLIKQYGEFSENIVAQYHDEVLNIDFNNTATADALVEKYDDETRNKIFQPLIKIINNTNCNLSIIYKNNNKRKQIPKVNQVIKEKILKKSKKENPPEDLKKVFVTITMELKENTDLSTISKKEIQEGTLFSTVSNSVQQELQRFEFDRYAVIFKDPITLNYIVNDGVFKITFSPLNINIEDTTRNVAFDKFMDTLEGLLESDYLAVKPKNINNKKYFDTHIADLTWKIMY